MSKNKATVLLLHGSKDRTWMEPFLEMRDKAAAICPNERIATACLQFGPPTLEEAVTGLAAEGITRIVVIPVFISTRGHVAKDVPILVEKVRNLFKNIEITTSPAVGEFPEVQQAMIEGIAAIAGE